ncbi:TPA: phage tail protein [Klebsiella pneumoniae]|uniref:phage tail-collar fiber domain-containing protein n=1 Tax=Klebsiella pneumoniae complex TaxID=3390273 RepID=UPI001CC1ACDE|nr:phage tail protein [Klebsiella pneumoniae]HBR1429611.1 phage tail protein [Klebsiella quasipneumoniae subsp. similipneumoniae]HCT4790232.1 phage tail protein [Klebsiella variicola]HEP0621140.1 phage tail protein [Klebsiella pneumoniae subsp. pneumoniae]MBZ1959074.1 phage tail protein [Klebsiella pneumoniae]MCP6290769.1 phage tail protein [Klebsiella pneumoniae]
MATGLTLTTAGAAEIEAAYQAGEVVHITSVLIGDGGGVTVPTDPDDLAAVTALFGQFGRETFDSDSSNEGVISGQIVINCRDYPGKTLREAGLVSAKGTLIAYGVYPATYLPAQSDSIIKEIILTLVLTLTHSSNVQLVIDPALATITQETGDKRYLRRALNLSDLADLGEARENLGLGNSATRNVGAEVGTVAAGDDSRINGALQKENNLSDLDDAGEALTNLGLSSNGEGFKAIVDALFYVGIVLSGEKSPAERFPWQTWADLSETFADRVVRIGSQYGVTGGSNKVKLEADNLPPHWHRSGDRSPGATWDPTTTHGTDNQKSGPLALTEGTYVDKQGLAESQNKVVDVTNEYVSLCMWKRIV